MQKRAAHEQAVPQHVHCAPAAVHVHHAHGAHMCSLGEALRTVCTRYTLSTLHRIICGTDLYQITASSQEHSKAAAAAAVQSTAAPPYNPAALLVIICFAVAYKNHKLAELVRKASGNPMAVATDEGCDMQVHLPSRPAQSA